MTKITTTNSTDCRKRWFGLWTCYTAMRGTVGGAIVELAVVVPIFSTLLLGAGEFARLAYAGIEVSNAARAGVAYGSQSSATASDIPGMQLAATNDSPNISGMTATATQFWSCSDAPSTQSSSPPTCTTGNHLLNYVQVRTTATVDAGIHVPGLPTTYTLQGLAIMRVL
jgi:Flp pilus assembly protein TadG